MSSRAHSWALPPLELYAERGEPADAWADRLEALVTSWPMSVWPRMMRWREIRFVALVNRRQAYYASLQSEALSAAAYSLKERLRSRLHDDAIVAESFALVREVSTRELGLRHFDVQIQGGLALLRGRVAEMNTGEGKTLTATLAAATAALAGTPVHVVTVNDYLAERDAADHERLYRALGLRVGVVVHKLSTDERHAAYACDVVYASNKEIAFDYLRDRLALTRGVSTTALKLRRLLGSDQDASNVVMRGLHYAIVDEADSVLGDEARTPLIISRQTDAKSEQQWAETALDLARELEEGRDYRIVRDERRVELVADGRARLVSSGEELGGIWLSRIRREESVRQALTALHLFQVGDHYLVRDAKVQIVDEYTGRIMADRSWSEGLHQLVEAKEGCEVTSRKVPLARITYQRFFRRYHHLAGMTGTARELRHELWSIYRLAVVHIPPNRASRRRRLPTRFFETLDEKWGAIAARAGELSSRGQPVLIGTRSVAASQTVSERLEAAGFEHVTLSAAQDLEEAEIIARAGQRGRITVATNMAGRGVDVRLGDGVAALGGLHVLLTERHDARRIDRQLEGRCARQGNPGSTEAMLSMQDPVLELVSFPALRWLGRLPGRAGNVFRALMFHFAQRRAERVHARARRQLMRQDRKLGVMLAFTGESE